MSIALKDLKEDDEVVITLVGTVTSERTSASAWNHVLESGNPKLRFTDIKGQSWYWTEAQFDDLKPADAYVLVDLSKDGTLVKTDRGLFIGRDDGDFRWLLDADGDDLYDDEYYKIDEIGKILGEAEIALKA